MGDTEEAKLEGSDVVFPTKIMNEHLICSLCMGYLRDAQTVTECLHTCEPPLPSSPPLCPQLRILSSLLSPLSSLLCHRPKNYRQSRSIFLLRSYTLPPTHSLSYIHIHALAQLSLESVIGFRPPSLVCKVCIIQHLGEYAFCPTCEVNLGTAPKEKIRYTLTLSSGHQYSLLLCISPQHPSPPAL